MKLAGEKGSLHQVNAALGVIIHAAVANSDAREVLSIAWSLRLLSEACCRRCLADFYFRMADVMAETDQVAVGLEAVERCRREIGEVPGDDRLARLAFIAGILHHKAGETGRALEEADYLLRELSFDSPWGYLVDNLALIAVYLSRTDEEHHFRFALGSLKRFRKRLTGQHSDPFKVVRAWLSWVEGEVYGRLGDARRALNRLELALNHLIENGPPKYAMAVALDLGYFLLRLDDDDLTPRHDLMVRRVKAKIGQVLRNQPMTVPKLGYRPDFDMKLDAELRLRLSAVYDGRVYPDRIRSHLKEARASFVAVVPSLVTREHWEGLAKDLKDGGGKRS